MRSFLVLLCLFAVCNADKSQRQQKHGMQTGKKMFPFYSPWNYGGGYPTLHQLGLYGGPWLGGYIPAYIPNTPSPYSYPSPYMMRSRTYTPLKMGYQPYGYPAYGYPAYGYRFRGKAGRLSPKNSTPSNSATNVNGMAQGL